MSGINCLSLGVRLRDLGEYTVGNKTIFACLEVLDCVSNIYFNLMVKILELFGHMLTNLSYMINKESRKSIGNFLRYNYFLA